MTISVAAATNTPSSPVPPGSERWWHGRVTFDTSYPSGGYAVTAATFGFNRLDTVRCHGTTLLGRLAAFDSTNSKILVFKAVLTENDVADIHADSVQVTAIGI